MIIWRAAPVFCSSCRRFGGSHGRSSEVPVGRVGSAEGKHGKEVGGREQRAPLPSALRALGPGAYNTLGRGGTRIRWERRARGKGHGEGAKRAHSPSSSVDVAERIAETRKTSYTKNYYLMRPLRSHHEKQTWIPFQASLKKGRGMRGLEEREKGGEGGERG